MYIDKQFRHMNASYIEDDKTIKFISYRTPMWVYNKKSKTLYLSKNEYSMTTKKQLNYAFRELLNNDKLSSYQFRKNLKTNDLVNNIRIIRKNHDSMVNVYYSL